jgi:hypothetical protein
MSHLTRRSLLAGLGAALAVPAAAQAPAVFSSVTVDIEPLLRRGAGPEAEFMRAVMQEELRRVLAGRIGGRGPRLVVRLQTAQFTLGTSGPPSTRGSDHLDGELLVVGRRGEILQVVPQLLALPPSGGSTIWTPTSERLRLTYLAQTYAQWVPRRI